MTAVKRFISFVLVVGTFPAATLAQQPAPELSLTANDTQDVQLYAGWPLIVHTTIMNSLRFNTGSLPPLVIAPNGAAWTSAIQFTATDASGQAHQWPLTLIGTPADPSLTLAPTSYVRFTTQMAPTDVGALLPGTYQLTATLQVSNSNAWNGIVQSRPVTVQVGPEPLLTLDQQFQKALLLAEYQTNAGDSGGALSTVQQIRNAQPTNPLAISAVANLLGFRGYPELAFFEANNAVTTYYQGTPDLTEAPFNLLSIYQGLFTQFATPGTPVADTIPPVTTATLSPQPNPAGWNNTNVKVTLNSTDNEPDGTGVKQITYSASGAQPIATTSVNAASYPIFISSEGVTVLNFFATDNANNAEAQQSVTIKLDKTPPTISATSRNPLPNAHGWNNTSVTVHFDCSDSLSGLAPGSGPIDAVVSAEGANQSFTETCQDVAGNSASATLSGINIDKTPPMITGSRAPTANSFGWNNTDITVSFACADSLSGIDTCGPSPQIVTSEGLNQSRTGTAVDLAGNRATAVVGNLNIDKTPPSISCTANPSVLWPPNNKLVSVTVSVSLSDSLSGPAGFTLLSATSNEPDSGLGDIQGFAVRTASTSGQLRAQRLGSGNGRVYTLKYSGTDRAGNSATCSTTVSVPHDQRH